MIIHIRVSNIKVIMLLTFTAASIVLDLVPENASRT
jgi:hypothetical protein